MKKIIAISAVTATMILFGSSAAYGCNDLWVGGLQGGYWTITADLSCHHGKIEWSQQDQLLMTATGLYGPDCRIRFENTKTKDWAVVNFQQNYCLASGGDITVTPISGSKPIYSTTRARIGEHGNDDPGRVEITGWE